ncbi:conjugal transfer protein [Streptomonospora litoralis]|uniref:Conjugative transposon protein TcpC n=1 Tax=Streptomonospora litoralis TaxID=2498135 RepID=A0A4P6Q031_9ACTN|nr:conjugal transfer protein [Streptomonospora litoralis]QBI52531.1 Conjugative transposon protein TcpC [Streptomonospora litoralis]
MARKPAARRGGGPDEQSAEADGYEFGDPPRRSRRPRAGTGGRWWLWVGRAVLWAFILVVIFNGIWMPLRDGLAEPSPDEEPTAEKPAFPETSAAGFAARFARVYLNASGLQGEERADALAGFVPEGRAASFAAEGQSLTGDNVGVVGVDVRDDHNAIVTLSADVGGSPMSLDVPVYAAGADSFVVSGPPALLAAPGRARLPEPESAETDAAAREELLPRLERFFGAYAEDPDYISDFVEPGARIDRLPPGTLEFVELVDIAVPADGSGDNDGRRVTAEVVWRPAGADETASTELTQSYELTVVRDGENWYVREIHGAPQSFGE